MITGLRELRKALSKYIELTQKEGVVIVTEHEKPVASLVSINKLRDLAVKTKDGYVLAQLREAQVDKNKFFLASRKKLEDEIKIYTAEAMGSGGKVPEATVKKLNSILSALQNLLSEDGTLEDQRLLMLLRQKSRSPISRVIDHDYYYVHKDFIDQLNNQITDINDILSKNKVVTLQKDLKVLKDLVENAIVRPKNKFDEKIQGSHSILIKMTKAGVFYSTRIYTIVPDWYESPTQNNYFISTNSPLITYLNEKTQGDKFHYHDYQYEILSIS